MLTPGGQPSPDGCFDPAYPGRHHEPDDDPWADDTWDMPLPGQQAALDALQWNWGEAYDIGCEDGLWWYRRRDHKGGRETATTPDELHTAIVTDYSLFPVDRAALPPRPDSIRRHRHHRL